MNYLYDSIIIEYQDLIKKINDLKLKQESKPIESRADH